MRGVSARLRTAKDVPAVWAFSGALLFGLAAQGMGLLNKFSYHDDIFSLFQMGETITSGRWMLYVLGVLEILVFGDGHFSLPLLNGLFSLLCVGLSAGLTVHMLKIRSRMLSALLGCVAASFPMLTALFGFMFAAPYYMLAMLMMTACGVLTSEKKTWWVKLLGCLLGGCSVGIYQAFLPMLLTLILLSDMLRLVEGEEDFADLWKTLLTQAACICGVMAVYLAGSRFFLSRYGLELSPYMGLNEAGSLPFSTYLGRAVRAYHAFFQPARNVSWDMYPQHVYGLYYLTMGLNLVFGAALFCRIRRRHWGKALLFAAMLALYPLGCNFIYVLSAKVHGLMMYGQVMHFTLLVLLADQMRLQRPRLRRSAVRTAAAVLAMISVMYARYDNQCYLKTAFQQQEAISWDTELIARIKSAQGYRDELPVAWVNREEMADASLYNMDELNSLSLTGYNEDIETYLNNWAWERFLQRWCGFGADMYFGEEVENWPEVRAMSCYPADGSILVVNDVVVVKFGEGGSGDV